MPDTSSAPGVPIRSPRGLAFAGDDRRRPTACLGAALVGLCLVACGEPRTAVDTESEPSYPNSMDEPVSVDLPESPDPEVTLHFVAKEGRGEELAETLSALCFEMVKPLSSERVILRAPASTIAERLGVPLELTSREVRSGPATSREPFAALSGDEELPPEIAALVERFYSPPPPDRMP